MSYRSMVMLGVTVKSLGEYKCTMQSKGRNLTRLIEPGSGCHIILLTP